MSERREILFGTGYTFVSTIVALITGILLRPIMVRFLGLGEYGTLMFALTISSVLALVADLGFAGALTKFIADAQDAARGGALLTVAFLASLLMGAAAAAAILVVSTGADGTFTIEGMGPVLVILAFQVPFSFGAAVCFAALTGLRRMRTYAVASAVSNLMGFAIISAAVVFGGRATAAALGMVAASAAGLGVLMSVTRRLFVRPPPGEVRPIVRRLGSFGVQMSATNAASVLLYQVDIILLGLLTGDAVLIGFYSVAILLARMLWILPGSISLVGYPALTEYVRDGQARRTGMFVDRALRFSAAVAGIGALIYLYFGREIIELLFGSPALPAFGPLVLLVVGAGVLGVMKSVATGIPGAGRPDIGLKIAVVGLVAGFLLNLLLIPTYGVIGAAVATSLAYSAIAILLAHFVRKVLRTSLRWGWFVVTTSWLSILALPFILGEILQFSPVVRWILGTGATVSFVALLVFRLLPRDDVDTVLAALRRLLRRPAFR